MGVINASNDLTFKSSKSLFDRIRKRLESFDNQNLIDVGDFHKHVRYVLERLGQAVYKECEAVVMVENGIAKLPVNFKKYYAAYKCSPAFHSISRPVDQGRPWIFYYDDEITRECPNKCCIDCVGEEGKTKVVIRQYVNEAETTYNFTNPVLLHLSGNVKDVCSEEFEQGLPSSAGDITIDTTKKQMRANFTDDAIYMQYYGMPFDENELPMIPVDEIFEKAIEYYIYTQLFEDLYWNSNVANIGQMLRDVRNQYDSKWFPEALYLAKLPSFQRMLESTRKQRRRNQFYHFQYDRTIVR